MKQIVEPIKDENILKQVKETLKDSFKYGIRNYTIFQVGKATLLRVSDVLRLKYDDIYDEQGNVRIRTFIHDKKTGKPNTLYLEPVEKDLIAYRDWLKDNSIESQWLFPSIKKQIHEDKHIDERQFYRIMQKVGELYLT